MSSFTIDIKDIKKLEKILANLDGVIKEDLDILVNSATKSAQAVAIKEAPVDMGALKQANNVEKLADMSYAVYNNKKYAGYVEFGTGKKVDVPGDLQAVAEQFKEKGDGSFEEGLQAIKDWCKRHGIEEEASYPIFLSILRNGVSPQPFLYPAFKEGKKVLVQDVTDYINNFGLDE